MEKKKVIPKGPSLKYTTSKDYNKPGKIANPYLQALGAPHVDSFNFAINEGLDEAIKDLYPADFESFTGEKVSIKILGASFSKPQVMMDGLSFIGVKKSEIMPTECRQRGSTYKGEFVIRVNVTVNGKSVTVDKSMGCLPVMVKSKLCHLDNMSPQELIENNEHADEWGGYFIIKGNERLARMLIVNRRNYPTTVKRPGWKTRGNMFTDLGVLVRSVKPDQTSTNNVLHFLSNGTAKLMFSHRRMMYYAPLIMIMKCLVDYPDHKIYRILLAGHKNDLYFVSCIQNMFRELHEEGLHTSADCRNYIGQMFKQKISDLPKWSTEEQVTDFLTKNSILIHLNTNIDKFHALVFMTQKLFSFVQNKCKVEGSDTVMAQEVLTGGHLYLIVLKERLQNLIYSLKKAILYSKKSFDGAGDLEVLLRRCGTFETKMETFLATGNAPSSYVSLPQLKGLAIIAENINRMRYMSHFKSLHRGSFFLEMRTTEARQLSGDAWGFVCPVHTPDGSPCGLLNHLAQNTQISGRPDPSKLENVQDILFQCGVEPISHVTEAPLSNDVYEYPVFLDGKLMGFMPENRAKENCAFLRTLKIKGDIPISTEIVLVPKKEVSGQFPGIFLFTNEARMIRPVINLATGQLELIGTMEQLYLDIAVSKSEIYSGITTHLELSKDAFLSNLALLVPMPDCNQSPRNMYQCQMGKQTMGTPIHNWPTNADTKLYRLQTPATPLFRPTHYDNISLDDYPMGTNAIVAVISYTGYDMEDAMIINRSAHQRGFAAGSIYKTEFITLDNNNDYFGKDPNTESLGSIDDDGLPAVGSRIQFEDPFYSYYNSDRNAYVVCKYRGKEEVFVDSVRLCGDTSDKAHKKACIVFRVPRNPTVGDKFASRAGQKGICSQLWPAEDLPFTESGLIPDILFNPHGFPSRMTIAMMIECMAGKSASLHGQVHDASPFRFNEQDTAIDYFGRLLTEGGYNYYGTERMYSGADGREMVADIFFGVIHYQRLRHMVSDKWQVRTTGAIDALTRQPVKGRRRGGGVRLGEMERDALMAHGASFLLHDRLFHCSDKTNVLICTKCGSLLGPVAVKSSKSELCKLCEKGQLSTISIPYVFKLFVTQLAAVNINVKINCMESNMLC